MKGRSSFSVRSVSMALLYSGGACSHKPIIDPRYMRHSAEINR